MIWISVDFSRGAGYLGRAAARTRTGGARRGAICSLRRDDRSVHVRMARRPDQRWLGGTIPIVFHTVVAAFQWMFGTYHVAPRLEAPATSRASREMLNSPPRMS